MTDHSTTDVPDPRIEAAARAMARHRLSAHSFSPTLSPDLVADLQQIAEDRLWPTLLDEARVALIAADSLVAVPLDDGMTLTLDTLPPSSSANPTAGPHS